MLVWDHIDTFADEVRPPSTLFRQLVEYPISRLSGGANMGGEKKGVL